MPRIVAIALALLWQPALLLAQKPPLPSSARWTVSADSTEVAATLAPMELSTRPESPHLRVSCSGRVAALGLQFAPKAYGLISIMGANPILYRFDRDQREESRATIWRWANELRWPAEASRYVPLLLTRDWLIVRFTGERGYQEATYDLGDSEGAIRSIVNRCPSLARVVDSTFAARTARGPQLPMPSAANSQERMGDWTLVRLTNRFDDSRTLIATIAPRNPSIFSQDVRLFVRSMERELEVFVTAMIARDTLAVQFDEGEWRSFPTRSGAGNADFLADPMAFAQALRGHSRVRLRSGYQKSPLEFSLVRSDEAIQPVLAASGRSP